MARRGLSHYRPQPRLATEPDAARDGRRRPASVDPWRPRGVKVRGRAEIDTAGQGQTRIRVTPEPVWSWGINGGAPKHFADRIEKRTVG